MAGRQDGIPIAEAATLLDLSQEAVRKRIQRGTLAGYKREGGWYVVLAPADLAAGRQDTEASGRQDDRTAGRQDSPPIEAEYRVTPEELQIAIERTGAKYINDFVGLYERINAELGTLYEARLAERDLALVAKDETIAAKDETIATQRAALATKDQALAADALAIAQLRQRVEAVEAERDRLIAAQAALAAPHAAGGLRVEGDAADVPGGFLARVRRFFGGE